MKLSGDPEKRFALFTEMAALLRKYGYEDQAQEMGRLANAPEAKWFDLMRVQMHQRFTDLEESSAGASVLERLNREIAEKTLQIEKLTEVVKELALRCDSAARFAALRLKPALACTCPRDVTDHLAGCPLFGKP